ncbi:MAG: ankyrin repeat domain-containing protein [Planctomycetota bacterium]
MLDSPAWSGHRDHVLTQYALRTAWFGDHARAAELLARVRGEVDMRDKVCFNTFTWHPRYSSVIRAEICAYTGPGKALLERADAARSGSTAWPLFKEALDLHKNDRAVRHYLLERMVHARLGHRPSEMKVGWTGLHQATLDGSLAEVRFLLDQGFHVGPRTKKGFTPLPLAAENGHSDIVKLLLDRGAEVNTCPRTKFAMPPLLRALAGSRNRGGHPETAALLLDRGAWPKATDVEGWGALHMAASYCKGDAILKRLLGLGLSPNEAADEGRTPLHCAAESGNAAALRSLLEAGAEVDAKLGNGATPLCIAAEKASPEVLNLLLERGADIEAPGKEGKRPLHYAARRRTPDAARLLLDRKAGIAAKDSIGMTALMHAAKSGSVGIVRLLLGRGAKVNAREKDRATALTYASRQGSAETVGLLLDAGAEIGAVDKYRYTPLHHAASSGHPQVVKILLEKGANPFATAARGRTVLDIAKGRRRYPRLARRISAVIDLLEKHIQKLKTPPPDEDDVF